MEWFEKLSPESAHVPTESVEETGFFDNANAAFAEMRRENLPIISRAQTNETMDYRRSVLNKYRASGQIPDEVFDFFQTQTGFDIDGLSMYARNELGLQDVMTGHEYETARNEEYDDIRRKEQEVFAAQNKWGILGEFGGRAAAIPTDPLYAASFFTGYGAATSVLGAAARVSIAEMAIEGVAQFPIADFKEELGVDYGAPEMLVNTLAAGAFGFIGGAAGKFLETRFAKLLPEEMTVEQALTRMVALSGPEGNDMTAPIVRVLQQSDPKAKAIDVLKNDENITLAANNRGSKVGADPRADVSTGYVDDLVTEYETMKQQAAAKKAEEAATTADEGVPRGTPKPEPFVPEGAHPLVKEQYLRVAELDDTLAKLEEVC